MHGYPQSLNVPTVTDLIGSLLHRVTAASRAWLPRRRVNGSAVAGYRSHGEQPGTSLVSLVGAGPGDPELLTLKALRTLREADVILHDQLVSAEVLALASPDAERIDVGKKGYGRACKQGDINDLMVALASAGRRVVRLKAGDPLMFGRLEEEIAALDAAGIIFEVIPGISAAQGAASRLGVPLTRRRGARRFQAITGHASDGRLPDDFDWSGVADAKATTAVYMPKATIDVLCAELLRRGLSAVHPAVAVFNATRANEAIVTASIGTLPERIAAVDTGAPCIILIGVDATKRALAVRSPAREHANA
jgi:uroporphyrin-III C-methyltransferase / precorrin-2 dehydrogenase / sirohydrochlorin ferrochelatase